MDIFCHVYLVHQSLGMAFMRTQQRKKQLGWSVSPTYSLWFKLVLMHRGNVSERTNWKNWKMAEGQRKPHWVLFLCIRTSGILHQRMDENNNLCNVFFPFSFLHAFSFLLLSLSLMHCQSLSLIHSLYLCNQIALSYTSTALWLLAAGFRCLQSGCTFQQANDCGRMKL